MTEPQVNSMGRIEVAPEVLTMIAREAIMEVPGVSGMADIPSEQGRKLFRRPAGQDGIVLDFGDNRLTFDIYLLMNPGHNVIETSHAVQKAVIEAMDKMVGIPVNAVHIHVEDVVYEQGQTA